MVENGRKFMAENEGKEGSGCGRKWTKKVVMVGTGRRKWLWSTAEKKGGCYARKQMAVVMVGSRRKLPWQKAERSDCGRKYK